MNCIIIFCFLNLIPFVFGNGCNECHCEQSLNLLQCYGYQISDWPYIANTSWIYDVTFTNTLLRELPIFQQHEYKYLEILKITNCPLINCKDIEQFRDNMPTVIIISDISCNVSTSSPHPTLVTTPAFMSTLTYMSTGSSTESVSTAFLPVKNTERQYLIIFIVCASVLLLLIVMTLLFIYCAMERRHCRSRQISMIEMTDLS